MRPRSPDEAARLEFVLSKLTPFLKPGTLPVVKARLRRRPDIDPVAWIFDEGIVYLYRMPTMAEADRLRAVLAAPPPEHEPAEPRRKMTVADLRNSIIRPRQPVR